MEPDALPQQQGAATGRELSDEWNRRLDVRPAIAIAPGARGGTEPDRAIAFVRKLRGPEWRATSVVHPFAIRSGLLRDQLAGARVGPRQATNADTKRTHRPGNGQEITGQRARPASRRTTTFAGHSGPSVPAGGHPFQGRGWLMMSRCACLMRRSISRCICRAAERCAGS